MNKLIGPNDIIFHHRIPLEPINCCVIDTVIVNCNTQHFSNSLVLHTIIHLHPNSCTFMIHNLFEINNSFMQNPLITNVVCCDTQVADVLYGCPRVSPK